MVGSSGRRPWRPRHAHLGQSCADGVLAGYEGRPACSAALLAVVVAES